MEISSPSFVCKGCQSESLCWEKSSSFPKSLAKPQGETLGIKDLLESSGEKMGLSYLKVFQETRRQKNQDHMEKDYTDGQENVHNSAMLNSISVCSKIEQTLLLEVFASENYGLWNSYPTRKKNWHGTKNEFFFKRRFGLSFSFCPWLFATNCVPFLRWTIKQEKRKPSKLNNEKNKAWHWLSAKQYRKEIQMFKL